MSTVPEQMRCWQVSRNGDPADVLERATRPIPQPGPRQILVKVHATACNFFDILLCQGTYQEKPPLPFVPGGEVAGEVVAVGSDVPADRAVVGSRVCGNVGGGGGGGYAEYAVMDNWAQWPESMSAAKAAALYVNYMTGICGLYHRGQVREGETVLVHAAAGGVGSAAVQLAKGVGATVIATAGGPEKCAVAKDLGADHVIDYRDADIAAAVKDLTGGEGADVVYDPVGGAVFDASRRAVAFEGRILVIGFTSGQIPQAPANHVLIKNYSVVGVHWGLYRRKARRYEPIWQARMQELCASGVIDPLIGGERPLDEAPAALVALGSRKTVGKLILLP